ncbi:SAM-dependent methyltransferase [Myxococcota bacterium]
MHRGARKVYAVDVGHGQLAAKLRDHPQVVNMEGVNARQLTGEALAEPVDLVVIDASFIGLGKLLPGIGTWANRGTRLLGLVKPQFEIGPAEARRARGVIRDAALRSQAIQTVAGQLNDSGWGLLAGVDSRLFGARGNLEHFLLAVRR